MIFVKLGDNNDGSKFTFTPKSSTLGDNLTTIKVYESNRLPQKNTVDSKDILNFETIKASDELARGISEQIPVQHAHKPSLDTPEIGKEARPYVTDVTSIKGMPKTDGYLTSASLKEEGKSQPVKVIVSDINMSGTAHRDISPDSNYILVSKKAFNAEMSQKND